MSAFRQKAAPYIAVYVNCDILDYFNGVAENSDLVSCCTVCTGNEDSSLMYLDKTLRVYMM
jgi:hypothetical protein